MPLARYGVLKGKAIQRMYGAGDSPHYQVHVVDDETDYRIAINVKSKLEPSELEYLVDDRFEHSILEGLSELPRGFTALASRPDSGALDFIRGNLFNRDRMVPLPYSVPGFDNDLNEKIDGVVQRAMATEDSLIYAFGQRWGPEPRTKDKYFGFLPGNGIHDIHMNQGNDQQFRGDDGVWQDGAVLVHFPSQRQWVGIFLKFQSQTWHTDDETGHRIGEPDRRDPDDPPRGDEPQGLVRIVGALVNPIESPERETVTLLNTSPRALSLAGWNLADKQKARFPLSGTLAPGATVVVTIPPEAQMKLSNQGGIITLLDGQGLKIDGISYTKAQASNPGWTLVF
jgi:uncharacterized protein YukJ